VNHYKHVRTGNIVELHSKDKSSYATKKGKSIRFPVKGFNLRAAIAAHDISANTDIAIYRTASGKYWVREYSDFVKKYQLTLLLNV